jgi:hypothetical protein
LSFPAKTTGTRYDHLPGDRWTTHVRPPASRRYTTHSITYLVDAKIDGGGTRKRSQRAQSKQYDSRVAVSTDSAPTEQGSSVDLDFGSMHTNDHNGDPGPTPLATVQAATQEQGLQNHLISKRSATILTQFGYVCTDVPSYVKFMRAVQSIISPRHEREEKKAQKRVRQSSRSRSTTGPSTLCRLARGHFGKCFPAFDCIYMIAAPYSTFERLKSLLKSKNKSSRRLIQRGWWLPMNRFRIDAVSVL